jgi:putative ABC transport system permease protein
MNKTSPRLALRFLAWFCPPSLYESIEGDLLEQFEEDLKVKVSDTSKVSDTYIVQMARRKFVWNVLKFFRPGILLRNKFSVQLNQLDMLNHFFKIFFRTTLKNGSYSFINITGLAFGLAGSILILLWVIDEISFDNFHQDKDRIYQIMGNHTYPTGIDTQFSTPGPLAAGLKELPEVEESCRLIFFRGHVLFNYHDQSIYEEGIHADPSLFNIFAIPIIEGDRTNPIPDINSIALSKKLANKYFPGESALGKVFRLNNNFDAKVTAVFEDVPKNSSLAFTFVLPYEIHVKEEQYIHEWGAWTGGRTYVKLHKGADKESVNKKIAEVITQPKIWPRWDSNVELFLFPLTDWRLHNNFTNGKHAGGRITYIVAFSIVAGFILLIACVNFMNLATARSMSRSREIGIRKVVGAVRQSIVRQFMGESILISFISLFIGLLIVHLLLPWFNQLTGKQIIIDYLQPSILGSLIGVTLFTGLVAGSYPSIFLSSLQAIHVLKGKLPLLTGASTRKALVVFQFSISVTLIVGAIIVRQQIEYMRNKNLGFDKENAFYFNINAGLRKNLEAFRNEALQNPAIKNVALSNNNPMQVFSGIVLPDNAWPGKTKEDNLVFTWLKCDQHFLSAFDFTLVEGRNFSTEVPSDSSNFIITEEAAKRMKLANPVGQQLNASHEGEIIGLVKDFHSTGLQGQITPVIISMNPESSNLLFVRYQPGLATEALKYIESLHKKFEPDFPMEYKFMDDEFGKIYESEIMVGKLATYFTVMAIFISCLGLFGLASFTAEKRVKEIGIRKIMGATVSQLVVLLCRDFILLIGIALIVGLPLAWWGSQKFLEGYAFHTDLSYSVFVITSLSMMAIALLTVSFQSAKAAQSNPVKNLRTE